MKGLLTIFALLPLLLPAQNGNAYVQKFWRQLSSTCQQDLVYEKSIEEVGENASHEKETHVYRLHCGDGSVERTDGKSKEKPGLDEFDYLFEYDCLNPYIKEHFDLKEGAEGLSAVLKSDKDSETPLKKQTFKVDPSGKLRFAESHILKDTRLYTLEVHVQVWFDAAGHYLRHETSTLTQPILKSPVRTLIKGRIVP